MTRSFWKPLSLALTVLLGFALFGATPSHAGANMTLALQSNDITNGASCTSSTVGLGGTFQSTDNDRFVAGNWWDFTAITVTDATGTPIVAVVQAGTVPGSFNFDIPNAIMFYGDLGNVPAARPFRLDYYDTGDPGADSPVSNLAFYNWVTSTYSPEFSLWFDPVAYGITACSGLPLITAPLDDRLNPEAASGPVAIYCNDEGLDIYAIDPETGKGHLVIRIEQAALDELPDAPEANTLLSSEGNVRVYQLTSGELQVVAGPDFEGKLYTFVFNGCPYAGGGYKADVE